MIRDRLFGSALSKERGFQWRGAGDISRIEGFSDNVFGFALTLLVVSLEVPRTFSDLEETLRGFIGFAFAFALLFLFWYEHYKFFRRYGLEGNTILWLNAMLLFVILFFVYPLKFLITFLGKVFSRSPLTITLDSGTVLPVIQNDQMVSLMIVYGLGFFIIYLIFTVMYFHAYRKRTELELSETEIIITKGSIIAHGANCCVGLASIALVWFGGIAFAGVSGIIYCFIGPLQGVLGYRNGKKVAAVLQKTASPE
ncbi:MAG: TMEM175 family protein [Bacteroidota bacterium]